MVPAGSVYLTVAKQPECNSFGVLRHLRACRTCQKFLSLDEVRRLIPSSHLRSFLFVWLWLQEWGFPFLLSQVDLLCWIIIRRYVFLMTLLLRCFSLILLLYSLLLFFLLFYLIGHDQSRSRYSNSRTQDVRTNVELYNFSSFLIIGGVDRRQYDRGSRLSWWGKKVHDCYSCLSSLTILLLYHLLQHETSHLFILLHTRYIVLKLS